ncbi:MAG: hypothetical protein ACQEQU_00885 [Spirochaetota bacterium]
MEQERGDRNRSDAQQKSRDSRRGNRKGRSQQAQNSGPPVYCTICGRPIDSISQAIGGPEKDQISHFDCILKQLREEEELKEGQKVSYIGNGNFAVVEYSNKNFTGGFTVIKRIPVENKDHNEQVKQLVSERSGAAVQISTKD